MARVICRRYLGAAAATLGGVLAAACGEIVIRYVQGPPGPAGPQGQRGATGATSAQGQAGAAGQTIVVEKEKPVVIATAASASPISQPPTATAVQPEPESPTVYVGNTDGDGVFLRRTRNLADRIAAYPDDTQLVVLGPDTSENGITWKHVRTPDGKVGYVPAQYTVPAATTATPDARVARPAPTAAAQSRGCGPQNLRVFYARLKQALSSAFPELVWTQTPGNTVGEARGLPADVILFDQGGPAAGDVDVELSLDDFRRLSPQQQNRSVQLAYAAIHFKVFGSLANSPHEGLLNWMSSAINSVTGTAYQGKAITDFGCGHEVKVALLPTTRVLFFSATSAGDTSVTSSATSAMVPILDPQHVHVVASIDLRDQHRRDAQLTQQRYELQWVHVYGDVSSVEEIPGGLTVVSLDDGGWSSSTHCLFTTAEYERVQRQSSLARGETVTLQGVYRTRDDPMMPDGFRAGAIIEHCRFVGLYVAPTPGLTPTFGPSPTPQSSPGYKVLFRNIEQYRGQRFYFSGEIIQVVSPSRFRVVLISDPTTDSSSRLNPVVYLSGYSGQRLLESDEIEFVGEVIGLYTYKSISNAQITIPHLRAISVALKKGA